MKQPRKNKVLPKEVRDEMVARYIPALSKIVKEELNSIHGIRFHDRDCVIIAGNFIRKRLTAGTKPESLECALRDQKIAYKINIVFQAFCSLGISTQAAYDIFYAERTFFTSDPITLVSKIKIVAKLLVEGDLPVPPTNKFRRILSSEDALKTIFGNKHLIDLCAHSESYINMVALSTKLSGGTLWSATAYRIHAVRSHKNEAQIMQEVRQMLSVVSDSKWEAVKHLAEKAGIKRPKLMSPERRAMFKAAAEARAQKKSTIIL